jgi:hypothetical protein
VVDHQPEHRDAGEAHGGAGAEPPPEVVELEVAQLVGEHGLDLPWCHGLAKRVEEHDPLATTQAREVRVGVRRPARTVHHENTLAGEAGPLQQVPDALQERVVVQRCELEEEGGDEDGVGPGEEQRDADPRGPEQEPPERAAAPDEPKRAVHERAAEQDREQRLLQEVAREERGRGAIEAEALLDDEGAVDGEGQQAELGEEQRAQHEGGAGEQRSLVPHPRQRLEAAAERERQQHGRARGRGDPAEAEATDRVVRGLLVGGERDRLRESVGDRRAMRPDVPLLPKREPEADAERGEERRQEERGQPRSLRLVTTRSQRPYSTASSAPIQ